MPRILSPRRAILKAISSGELELTELYEATKQGLSGEALEKACATAVREISQFLSTFQFQPAKSRRTANASLKDIHAGNVVVGMRRSKSGVSVRIHKVGAEAYYKTSLPIQIQNGTTSEDVLRALTTPWAQFDKCSNDAAAFMDAYGIDRSSPQALEEGARKLSEMRKDRQKLLRVIGDDGLAAIYAAANLQPTLF